LLFAGGGNTANSESRHAGTSTHTQIYKREPAGTTGQLLQSKAERQLRQKQDRTKGMKDKRQEKTAGAAANAKARRPDNWRETIESVVVAFVLAFLFRTFEAEAFVIPTGSMAPTLYGQHRDVDCAQCGTHFTVGVSMPDSPDSEIRNGEIVPEERSQFAVCPNANCRYLNNVLKNEIFAGDRILVNKFPYEFGEPQRWDVVVFKFPVHAKINYIKRLVGLPGEEVELRGGDVRTRRLGEPGAAFRIARKLPEKQRRLQLLVHDNDHPARDLLAAGWPESWDGEETSAWTIDTEARAFSIASTDEPDTRHWLRYSHYLPSSADWTNVRAGTPPAAPKPELVRDFYAYNARITARNAAAALAGKRLPDLPDDPNAPEQWVTDLTLNGTVEVLESKGELTLELVEGWRRYYARIDLSTGQGVFASVHEQDRNEQRDPEIIPLGGTFETGMKKPGTHTVSFANVDDRLCLWVNDRLVKWLDFDEGSKFEPQSLPVYESPRDKTPVRIGAKGAKLRVSHLKIERDVYYLSELHGGQSEERTFELKDDPDDSKDEFLMLGDNSPHSSDSRVWQTTHAVQRHLLIGKAFFVYWPHAVPFLNDGRGFPIAQYEEPGGHGPPIPKFSIPFYPHISRMRRIR
jgi:signal peptidase I